MAFSRRRSSIRPKTRRKLVWARDGFGVVVGTGGLLSRFPLSQFEGSYGSQLIGCTVMRIRGVISATLVGDSGGLEAFGAVRVACRITDHADLASQDYAIGAMYGNQAQADWFMFEPFMLDNSGSSTALAEVDTTSASEIRHIDVKARRKLQELDQTVEMVIGAPSPTSTQPPFNTAQIRVRGDLSFLIALP